MLLASSSSSGNSDFLQPNGTFVFELVMFIIVLGVVAKFILPPLQKAMADRAAAIHASLQASDEGHLEAERLEAERVSVLERAHSEARDIVEVATREAERLRTEARQRGQNEFESKLAVAQETIVRESAQLRAETIAKLDVVVIAAAERIIGVDVNPTKHRAVIAAAIAQAEQGAEE